MASAELLIAGTIAHRAKRFLVKMGEAVEASGDTLIRSGSYRGKSDWLIMYGVGSPYHNSARNRHVRSGRNVLLWDLGYTNRETKFRMSINNDHPQPFLDKTKSDKDLGVELKNLHNPDGPIILVGIGRKSRSYLRLPEWEKRKLDELKQEFPGRRIVFRPKGRDSLSLDCDKDEREDFREVLNGASLVVAHHSNCAIDAAIAGIPFRVENGAASWLKDSSQRQDFLNRLAYWQWTAKELDEAWKFAKAIASS